MRLCLQHPTHGYYTAEKHVIFGKQGDFITSPEISQVFGELIGVWFVSRLQARTPASKWQLVECGPGLGTLAVDMLRTLRRFKGAYNGLERIHLVETSAALREVQSSKLGLVPSTPDCYVSDGSTKALVSGTLLRPDGTPIQVHWHDRISEIGMEENQPAMVLAHVSTA
jgi:NADH dehydrogenase [ubiquinone] 1 alpha subcomplex assembly factor 7